MNSWKLSQKHSEVYFEFGFDADLILKIPHTISLLWWTSCVIWWLVVERKIPLNCFISIRKTKLWKITFGKYFRYNPAKESFEQLENGRFGYPGNTFTRTLQNLYPGASYELSVLNEIPGKTTDAISFLSILALENFESWEFNMEMFLNEIERPYESEFIRKLIRKSELLRLDFDEETKGLSSMASIYCAICKGSNSIIHRAEALLPLPGKNGAKQFSQSDQRNFSSTSFYEILWGNWEMPFEILMVRPIKTEKNSHWYWELENTVLWAQEISEIECLKSDLLKSWSSWMFSLKSGIEKITACSDVLTLSAIHSIRKHYEWKIIESELFWMMRKAHEGLRYLLWKSNLENSSDENILYGAIDRGIRKHTNGEYLIYRTGNSIDMNYVILLSKKISQEEVLNLCHWLKAELTGYANILFSSILDRSDDCSVWTVDFKELAWSPKGEWISIQIIWRDWYKYLKKWFLEFVSEYDWIVMDIDLWKIYANGNRATSKEFASQQFTSEILFRLTKEGKVRSTDLLRSTYSTSRNEILSKILIPLKRYLSTHAWVDIEWLIDWTESDFQFEIKWLENAKIALVKRAFQD